LSQRALALARELGNRYDEAHSLGQSGTMYRLLGREDEALASLTAALALGRDLEETRVQAEALLELGRLHAGPRRRRGTAPFQRRHRARRADRRQEPARGRLQGAVRAA
jgi:tetratricopeptide (TPR) repeat protein